MKFWSTFLPAFLLGIVVTAENHTDTKTPEQKVEKPNHEQQTTTTNHDVKTKDAENQQHIEQPPPSNGSVPDQQTEVTPEVELTADEIEDVSCHVPGTNFSRHQPGAASTLGQKPKYRRYFDLFSSLAIQERYTDGKWERIFPPPQPEGNVTHTTNVTRFLILENGTKAERRTKYDYSYDNVHWYRPSRIRMNISHPEHGIVYKYKFGPRKWISPYNNRIFSSNQTNLTLDEMGAGRFLYLFGKEESFFRPPVNFSGKFNNSYDSSFRKEVYRYGPVTVAGQTTVSAAKDSKVRHKYPTGNRYYGYGFHRNQYPDQRRWYGPPNDGRWNRPYYDHPHGYPAYEREPRYYDNGYNQQYDRNYGAYPYDNRRSEPAGYYQDRGYDYRYENNYNRGGYDQSPRGAYNDGRSDRQYDTPDPQAGRRYDQGYGYDQGQHDQKYGESYQDGKGYNQGYGNGYDNRNRDYQSNNDGRRSDGSTYRESATGSSYNSSGYQQQQQPYRSDNYQNRRAGQHSYPGEERTYNQYRYQKKNREHGESYETFKWKFPYLDRNNIPEDQQKQADYFVREYYDILVKTSKHLWIMHRDIRTVLQDIEVMKQNSINPKHIPVIINGSMILLSNLASAINNHMDGKLTTEDVRNQPIDRNTYARLMNNFDKLIDFLEEYRKPEGTTPVIEDLYTRIMSYKKYLYITYGDIGHMMTVLRRTMRKYGFLEMEQNTE